MNRNRLLVFSAIIIGGILIGIYFLSGPPEAADPGDADRATEVPSETERPPAQNLEPGDETSARALLERAQEMEDSAEKVRLLRKIYDSDPTGKVGGMAAVELADYCQRQGEYEKATQWYTLARRAPLVGQLKRVNEELKRTRSTQSTQSSVDSARTLSEIRTETYVVQSGDVLSRIGRRQGTTAEAIMKLNNMTSDLIRPGDELKIPQGTFNVVVSKSNNTLTLLQNNRPIKVYPVALGREDRSPTPTGTFRVENKLVDPHWRGIVPPGDPKNILGSRWIGFKGPIGIHGCPKQEEHSIGQNVTEGCVRMYNRDVEEIYKFLVPDESKVTITE